MQDIGAHKIGRVVEKTGVSRELIHHYLRQGLLPPSPTRARYSALQERLLHLIKRLREDHGLSLEAIRNTFERFQFDPERLEPLTRADSLAQRLVRFAEQGELSSPRTLTARELAAEAGVTDERLADYIELRMVGPLDGERFSVFDVSVVALCERGVALGIPFDSLRTIAAYIRIAFQLEHAEVFGLTWAGEDPESVADQLFLKREVVQSLLQSLLQGLVQRHVFRSLQQPRSPRLSLDDVVYRPSRAFVRRHGLQQRIERLREGLRRRADGQVGPWREVAELQLHAGQYREAAFFLDQALERWPARGDLKGLFGITMVLSGQGEEGCDWLARVEREHGELAPVCDIYRSLTLFFEEGRATRTGAEVRELVDRALSAADHPGLAVRLYGGWLLTALPPAFADQARGRALLGQLLRELEEGRGLPRHPLPGQVERYLINTAYLLHESARSLPDEEGEVEGFGLEDLRTRICRLDPGCAFAQRVYLEEETR